MRRDARASEAIPLAKLRPPPLHPRHVPRPGLTFRLEGAWEAPVTLLSAPAGFGKTSAVVAALQARAQRDREAPEAHVQRERPARGVHPTQASVDARAPVAWLGLDEGDDDPQRFFRLLGAALQRAVGHGAELERALAGPQAPPPRALLTPLLNGLTAAAARVLVCLDDVHLLTDARIFDDLAFLIEQAPPGLRLLMATRADPPLPLHRWRARGQLLELRADDLRLAADETAALLASELGRSVGASTITAVQRATEGWAAGVRLASLALLGAAATDEQALVERLELGEGFALEYLAEEVLARLGDPLAAFLLDTASLEAFAPALVDAVRGTDDAQQRLSEARARGLFLQTAGAPPGAPTEGGWWRFHRLFRTLLLGRLRAADPPRERTLQRRAGAWFESHGATEAALEYALAAGDGERATRLLDAVAYGLVMDGRARFVERALERLPEAERARAPRARLAYGWALLLRGRYDDLDLLLTDLRAEADVFGPPDRAQLTALCAVLADTRGHAHEALALAEAALAAAPEGDAVTRAAATMALAGAQRELGRSGEAVAAYERALPLCRASRLAVPEGLARAHLGLLYLQRGRLRKAISVSQPLAGGATHPAAAAALAARCDALLEQDERDAVRRALPEVTALAERVGQPAVLANVHLVWSRLHRADGDALRAREALEAALAQAERGVPGWIRALVSVRAAEASLGDGDVAAAEAHLRSAEALGPQGPVATALVLARARHRLERAGPGDVEAALAAARSLVEGMGPPVADADPVPATDPDASPAADSVAGSAPVAKGTADPGDGVRIAALVLQALAEETLGEPVAAQATLARAVRRAEPEGFVRTFVEAGQTCAALLSRLGHPYASRLLEAFPRGIRAHLAARDATPALQAVTERERDILRALASARTYRQIADELGVSVNTVRFHVKNVYAKLAVNTRLEAVERARQLGWLSNGRVGHEAGPRGQSG